MVIAGMKFKITANKWHFVLLFSIIGIRGLRYILDQKLSIPYIAIVSLLWIVLYTGWMQHARQRFSQKRVRRHITLFSSPVIVFMLLHDESPHATTITCFVPNEKKQGGSYKTVSGKVCRYDEFGRFISLNTGEVIFIDDLVSVDSSYFDKTTL